MNLGHKVAQQSQSIVDYSFQTGFSAQTFFFNNHHKGGIHKQLDLLNLIIPY